MKDFRYLPDVATLKLDQDLCVGCGICSLVCPHGVFEPNGRVVEIVDLNGCMECGACALNCPVEAISVNPGVGCASLIINTWLHEKGIRKGSGSGCCC